MIKKTIIMLLALVIAIYPPFAYANLSSWTAQKVGMIGNTGIVQAISGNNKSVAKIKPTARMVAKVLKTANGLSLLHTAVTAMLGATDYVLDPENNQIRHKEVVNGESEFIIGRKSFSSAEDACNFVKTDAFLSEYGLTYARFYTPYESPYRGKFILTIQVDFASFRCDLSVATPESIKNNAPIPAGYIRSFSGSIWNKGEVVEKVTSLESVANYVLEQAQSGNVPAQTGIEQAIKDEIKAGSYDNILNSNAVPINGKDGATGQTGQTGANGKDGADAPPIDVSSIVNAISSLADRLTSQFSRLETQQETIISELQTTNRVINIQTDEILERQKQTKIAIEGLDMKGELITGQLGQIIDGGKLVNQKIDDVVNELKITKDINKVGFDNVQKALEQGLKGELINQKIDEAIQEAKRGNKTVADAFKDAIDKQIAEQARQNEKAVSAVKDAETAITELAKAEAQSRAEAKDNADRIIQAIEKDKAKAKDETKPKEQPFELPAFCQWAKPVCDLADWFKKDPDLKDFDVPKRATDLQDPSRFDKNYVSVNAQCPADVVKEIPLPGRSFRLVFEMTPICDFASIYLRPVIIFLAYIYGALSIGNAFKLGG